MGKGNPVQLGPHFLLLLCWYIELITLKTMVHLSTNKSKVFNSTHNKKYNKTFQRRVKYACDASKAVLTRLHGIVAPALARLRGKKY